MITAYTLKKSEEWDKIVKSIKLHDVYYLSGYAKAFWINGDGEPVLLYYEDAETRAINVIIKRDLADYAPFVGKIEKNTLFDATTPYGYGGWLVEGENYSTLRAEYEEFCQKEHIICEFVRFHPLLENWKTLNELYTEIRLGETVFMDTSSEETIWSNLTSKNRNMIRKAKKNGLKVYWGRDPELITPFMEMYNATMDKDNAEEYYYFGRDFYESILEDLKQNAMWFYAKKDKNIAAAAIFLFCNGKMHYHLSASKKEYQQMAPTNLLLYEAAVWAASQGYLKLHLGGGLGSEHDNLYKFKKAFNRNKDTLFYIGTKIFDPCKYEECVQLRMKNGQDYNEETTYFPKYRG